MAADSGVLFASGWVDDGRGDAVLQVLRPARADSQSASTVSTASSAASLPAPPRALSPAALYSSLLLAASRARAALLAAASTPARRGALAAAAVALAGAFALGAAAGAAAGAGARDDAGAGGAGCFPNAWGPDPVTPPVWRYDTQFATVNLLDDGVPPLPLAWAAERGTAAWPRLRARPGGSAALFPACAGALQSPIDIDTGDASAVPSVEPLRASYPDDGSFHSIPRPNGAPGWQVKSRLGGDFGTLTVCELGLPPPGLCRNFSALQLHMHVPSEHTIDGVRFPAEMHILHAAEDAPGGEEGGALAVLSILYPIAPKANPALVCWLTNAAGRVEEDIPNVRLADVVAQAGNVYYRYDGSLTTPPCYETVRWHVTVSDVGISPQQALVVAASSDGVRNFRPTQPLNGRPVTAHRQRQE